jgi:hypothetical protein
MKFPKHEASLRLAHNRHKDYYETVAQAIMGDTYGMDDWVSPEQREKALGTGEVWELVWCPHTPVGFCKLRAADLDVLLAAASGGE